MQRCIQLAQLGALSTAPNPMVGAVLVHGRRILAEGYHQQYGEAHAEPNCLAAVSAADRHLLPYSTLYVSLEPCSHYGKTPPCADLIIKSGIKEVVVGCQDTYSEVAGRGIARLQDAGINVVLGVLEKECKWLNRKFITYHELQRPYITLKWAQTSNGIIGSGSADRMLISGTISQRFTHQLRATNEAILVGHRTAVLDEPLLNNRYFGTKQPRAYIASLATTPSALSHNTAGATVLHYTGAGPAAVQQLIAALKRDGLGSVLIEGGAATLQYWINSGLWDEAFVLTAPLGADKGVRAPLLTEAKLFKTEMLGRDRLEHFVSSQNGFFI